MHFNCILDSVANLPIRLMVFVGNVQKPPIASHVKDLDPSIEFLMSNVRNKRDINLCPSIRSPV